MKKYFVFAIAALAALASCSKVEISAPEVQSEIGLVSASYLSTKVGAISGTELKDAAGKYLDMMVYGQYTNSEASPVTYQTYLNGVAFSRNPRGHEDNLWAATAKAYYWPAAGLLTFAAFSPSDAGTATATYNDGDITDIVITGFDNTAVAAQKDLLYSDKLANITCKTSNTSKALAFHHAQAQVVLKAAANIKAEIKSIVLENASEKGTLTITPSTTAAYTTAEWTNVVAADFTANLLAAKALTAQDGKDKATATYAQVATEVLTIPSTPVIAKVTYTYDSNGDGNLTTDDLTVTAPVDLKTTEIQSWVMGKKYIYNLFIGANEIEFSTSVADWVDGGSSTIAL